MTGQEEESNQLCVHGYTYGTVYVRRRRFNGKDDSMIMVEVVVLLVMVVEVGKINYYLSYVSKAFNMDGSIKKVFVMLCKVRIKPFHRKHTFNENTNVSVA